MFHLACSIPYKIVIACSGGSDSQSLLTFLHRGKRNITALHINHNTPHSIEAEHCVREYCRKLKINLEVRITNPEAKNEEGWRNERLAFYKEWTSQSIPVATAHTSDDNLEWYLLSSIHGKSAFMKPVDKEHLLLKPFLLTPKKELLKYCQRQGQPIPYVIDPTNLTGTNARAILRQSVIPNLLKIHPGMETSIRRQLKAEIEATSQKLEEVFYEPR